MHMMAFRSKYYVPIPENISWPQYVFQNFEKYGDNKAVVSYKMCTIPQSIIAALIVVSRCRPGVKCRWTVE